MDPFKGLWYAAQAWWIGELMVVRQIKTQVKRTIWSGMRQVGFDVRRAGPGRFPDLADFLAARQVDLVLDVGANIGQFGKALRSRGYRGEMISFEPVNAVYRQLKATADRDGNWQTHNMALGAAAGRAALNVSRSTVFSSILDQSPDTSRMEPDSAVIRQEEVTVARLDDLVEPSGDRIVFLKIDTQGYERLVL